jgi:hypothetical protein
MGKNFVELQLWTFRIELLQIPEVATLLKNIKVSYVIIVLIPEQAKSETITLPTFAKR